MPIDMHDIEQLDNVLVLRFLEKRDLSDRGAGHALIFALQANLFQGNHPIRIVHLPGFVDDTVCAWRAMR